MKARTKTAAFSLAAYLCYKGGIIMSFNKKVKRVLIIFLAILGVTLLVRAIRNDRNRYVNWRLGSESRLSDAQAFGQA
jgi:hypothetical protein